MPEQLSSALNRVFERSTDRHSAVLILLAVTLFAAAFVVSPGLFTVDEVIFKLGSLAILQNSSFVVENGWSEFASEDLRLWLLVNGPAGLVPQYPAGHAVLGAPFIWLFGERGLMMVNVIAGIGLIFATYALARRLFADRTAALLAVALLFGASFTIEYIYAVWPHIVPMLGVTMALVWIVDCLDAEDNLGRKAMAAGAAIGLGFLVRTDTILAIPAFGLIVLLLAKAPIRTGFFFGLGLLPAAALAAAANHIKFGSFNPISYGQTAGGGTSLSSHIAPIIALALISAILIAWRFTSWRPGKREYTLGLVALAAFLLFSETARKLIENYLSGAWALVFDATAITEGRSGMTALPDGTLSFWGHWKKALGQSMPWLGLLALAIGRPAEKNIRRSQLVILILVTIWTLPFFVMAWHGGMGSNMRYLLPLLPALSALSAKLLVDLMQTVPNALRILLWGGLLGLWLLVIWIIYHPSHVPGSQQLLSTYLFLSIAALALLSQVRWDSRGSVRIACLGSIGAGLTVSLAFLALDFTKAQSTRAGDVEMNRTLAKLPDHAVVYAPARFLASWAFKPGRIAALPSEQDGGFDYALIDKALAKNYRVLIWPGYVNPDLRQRYGARLAAPESDNAYGDFLEVKAAELQARQAAKH